MREKYFKTPVWILALCCVVRQALQVGSRQSATSTISTFAFLGIENLEDFHCQLFVTMDDFYGTCEAPALEENPMAWMPLKLFLFAVFLSTILYIHNDIM